MPLDALGLVLLAAVAHATWNLLAKGAGGGAAFVWLTTLAALAALTAPAVAILVTGGLARIGWAGLGFMVGSGALHAVYFVCVQRGYRTGDLSLVYPLARGTGPLLATLGAVVLLGERPTVVALAGGLAITLAVLSLAGRPRAEDREAVAYALATGVLIAAYTLWDKHAVDDLAQPPVVYLWGSYLTMTVLLLPVAIRRRSELAGLWRDGRRAIIGVGLLGPGAYVLVLVALTTTGVAYVAPAREVSIVIGTLLGTQVLGEGGRVRRLWASGVIVAGVLALAVG